MEVPSVNVLAKKNISVELVMLVFILVQSRHSLTNQNFHQRTVFDSSTTTKINVIAKSEEEADTLTSMFQPIFTTNPGDFDALRTAIVQLDTLAINSKVPGPFYPVLFGTISEKFVAKTIYRDFEDVKGLITSEDRRVFMRKDTIVASILFLLETNKGKLRKTRTNHLFSSRGYTLASQSGAPSLLTMSSNPAFATCPPACNRGEQTQGYKVECPITDLATSTASLSITSRGHKLNEGERKVGLDRLLKNYDTSVSVTGNAYPSGSEIKSTPSNPEEGYPASSNADIYLTCRGDTTQVHIFKVLLPIKHTWIVQPPPQKLLYQDQFSYTRLTAQRKVAGAATTSTICRLGLRKYFASGLITQDVRVRLCGAIWFAPPPRCVATLVPVDRALLKI
ncbi:hypothetical protein GALMADRAFT_144100 [Galerina marginata CBS 339.88]|uniref:Uncharacterized protein n=1 Tax=Galerina marginata (strain CBS 339.88) TaxID=685588 RepID=A0A067SJA2_GALM3|nr:hypothetical protein GALMADRAFT_144100 [Galerina marginata CBS 339.88]